MLAMMKAGLDLVKDLDWLELRNFVEREIEKEKKKAPHRKKKR